MNRKLLNAQRPDLVRHAESSSANYRNDENVISNSAPTKYRQILVENSSKEYSTGKFIQFSKTLFSKNLNLCKFLKQARKFSFQIAGEQME